MIEAIFTIIMVIGLVFVSYMYGHIAGVNSILREVRELEKRLESGEIGDEI